MQITILWDRCARTTTPSCPYRVTIVRQETPRDKQVKHTYRVGEKRLAWALTRLRAVGFTFDMRYARYGSGWGAYND